MPFATLSTPLGAFGAPLGPLRIPLGLLWPPLGLLWAHLGSFGTGFWALWVQDGLAVDQIDQLVG